jgi:hypothetical protein
MYMLLLGKVLCAALLVVVAAAPSAVSAAGLSFGGRIVAVIPCMSAFGPSLHVTIKPAGVFSTTYIWTPATFTLMVGPPRTLGQQVLGIADIPYVCFVGKFPLYGLRMQLVGTSAF